MTLFAKKFTESSAFPTELRAEANKVILVLAKDTVHPPHSSFQVHVNGEILDIPQRVHYKPTQVMTAIAFKGNLGTIALCLGTRHWDGFVREYCLKQLIRRPEPWIIPFVIQLIGEYVLPILLAIEAELPHLNAAEYHAFYLDNLSYYHTTCRRVVSYWNEFYRDRFPRWPDYPGYDLLISLNSSPFNMKTGLPQRKRKKSKL